MPPRLINDENGIPHAMWVSDSRVLRLRHDEENLKETVSRRRLRVGSLCLSAWFCLVVCWYVSRLLVEYANWERCVTAAVYGAKILGVIAALFGCLCSILFLVSGGKYLDE